MCSLIENALLNLLNVHLNYLSKHSLPNCQYAYTCSDVGGVRSSFYTFNAQLCRTQPVKNVLLRLLKKSWGEP